MGLVGMKETLGKARAGGYGVGCFDGFDSISIMAVLEECKAKKAPAVLICAALEWEALGPRGVAETARSLSDMMGMDVCLHLDHGDSFERVVEAIDSGFSSVMIDGSSLNFADNIALTRKVVEYAHGRNVMVEAELGAVGRVDDSTHEGGGGSMLTNPDQAGEFVEKTGCDYLAVSIGNVHGLYTAEPKFNFEVLQRIHDAVSIPLALHGGSGTPVDQLQKAVALGMAKVNVASELGRAFTQTYFKEAVEQKVWWAQAKSAGKSAIRQVIGRWIDNLGSAGKA